MSQVAATHRPGQGPKAYRRPASSLPVLRCRCQACDATFFDSGATERCPACGKKGRLQPLAIANGPPLEAQLAQAGGRLPAMAGLEMGQAVVTATVRRSPVRKAGAVTLIVTAALALLQGLGYLMVLAVLREFGETGPRLLHMWGLAMLAGGLLGLVGSIMTLQGSSTGRTLALAAAGILTASLGILFLPDGIAIIFFGFLLPPLIWLGALASLVMLVLPDRPIASDRTVVTAVGSLG